MVGSDQFLSSPLHSAKQHLNVLFSFCMFLFLLMHAISLKVIVISYTK